jgi:inhibitor of cysteine peptidase
MKKTISKFLMATIVMAGVGAEAFASSETVFLDIGVDHANYDAIEFLKDAGVVEGYDDGSFKAESTINRAEFLKIVMEASDFEIEGEDCYDDVDDEWFAPYVCKATELGLVKGYDDGLFRPGQTIKFSEASKIVANTLDVDQPDDIDWNYWYQPYVISLEVLNAIPTSIPSFSHELSRGEMAEMIWRVQEVGYHDGSTFRDIKNKLDLEHSEGKLSRFDSCTDLEEHVAFNSNAYYDFYDGIEYDAYYGYYDDFDDDTFVFAEEEAAPMASIITDGESAGDLGGGLEKSADEASETNVQVAGVDEADIVKNDLEYIYVLKDNEIRIIDAYPAEDMFEFDTITFEDESFWADDMYVDGDRLVVIGETYSSIYEEVEGQESKFAAKLELAIDYEYDYWDWDTLTKVYIFDISDRSDAEMLRSVVFEGYYASSRKVDDRVYVVVDKYEDYYYYDEEWDDDELLPLHYDSEDGDIEPITGCGDVLYFPGVDTTDYLILASIPFEDEKAEVEEEVVLGSSGDVYSSRDNLYVAEYNYNYDWWGWDNYDYEEETTIHKFALNEGDIAYQGEGKVPGTVLNQFSMDENDGYFRVATTLGDAWNGSSRNNLYILDSDMNRVGSVEDIAPGESIYSVRFMGERAYMVTFKKVDPFFVIDVADPKAPKILGELKIPGYSDYLHPYGDDYVIGFGKDTVEADDDNWWGTQFAWYQGLKIAMFDVSDLENPKELHKVVIGDRGTESELLYDHKALLFDANKGLMALPIKVAELSESVKESSTEGNEYGDYTWQGAYVYDVSAEDGFQLKGKISHYADGAIEKEEWWYSGPQDIKRILYIGDVLYTVSMDAVQANDINTLDKIMKLILPSG